MQGPDVKGMIKNFLSELMNPVTVWGAVWLHIVVNKNNYWCQLSISPVPNYMIQFWKSFTIYLCCNCSSQLHKIYQKHLFGPWKQWPHVDLVCFNFVAIGFEWCHCMYCCFDLISTYEIRVSSPVMIWEKDCLCLPYQLNVHMQTSFFYFCIHQSTLWNSQFTIN